eukprot:1136477-Prorocentrum_minimum.AAC.4
MRPRRPLLAGRRPDGGDGLGTIPVDGTAYCTSEEPWPDASSDRSNGSSWGASCCCTEVSSFVRIEVYQKNRVTTHPYPRVTLQVPRYLNSPKVMRQDDSVGGRHSDAVLANTTAAVACGSKREWGDENEVTSQAGLGLKGWGPGAAGTHSSAQATGQDAEGDSDLSLQHSNNMHGSGSDGAQRGDIDSQVGDSDKKRADSDNQQRDGTTSPAGGEPNPGDSDQRHDEYSLGGSDAPNKESEGTRNSNPTEGEESDASPPPSPPAEEAEAEGVATAGGGSDIAEGAPTSVEPKAGEWEDDPGEPVEITGGDRVTEASSDQPRPDQSQDSDRMAAVSPPPLEQDLEPPIADANDKKAGEWEDDPGEPVEITGGDRASEVSSDQPWPDRSRDSDRTAAVPPPTTDADDKKAGKREDDPGEPVEITGGDRAIEVSSDQPRPDRSQDSDRTAASDDAGQSAE